MKFWHIYWRGLLMGAADLVPGISGGTLAFITGIYERLINSLSSFRPNLIKVWRQQGLAGVFVAVDAGFLLSLGAGIFSSILALAHLINWLLASFPMQLNGLFFGLVAGSAVIIFQAAGRLNWPSFVALALCVVIAGQLGAFLPSVSSLSPLTFFFAGMLAVCALLLPGVSGSFILLSLGLYAPLVAALTQFNWPILSAFIAGAGIGVLSFSHLLKWLLKHQRQTTLAGLLGFVLGSLKQLWPWQQLLSYRVNSQGELSPLTSQALWPAEYTQIYALPAKTLPISLIMLAAFVLVVWLAKKA